MINSLNATEMKQNKLYSLVLAFGLLLSSKSEIWAQERNKDKEKDRKEYKGKDYKEYKDKDKDKDKDRYKEDKRDKDDDREDRYERDRPGNRRSGGILGGVLGRPEDSRREGDWDRERKRDKDDERYERDRDDDRDVRRRGGLGGVLGRVILPPAGTAGPRQLAGVPRGHYPPPGSCRIWYPNRPPGHQPPPTSCGNLRGVRLEPGAFILHGDRAYDADYDWREEERRRPGSVGRDILDILFPNRR